MSISPELLIWLEAVLGKKLLKDILKTKDEESAMRLQLNFLAQLIIFLFGGYNKTGIRQWFRRKRKQLDNKSPGEILSGEWNPQDIEPQKVLALARSMNV